MTKTKLSLLDLESLRQVQILSNTPAYLYKHFKNDVSVRTFAESCSVDDFAALLASLANRKRKTGNYQILLYAIAVSLSFKEYSDARPLLEKLGKFDVKWLSRITQLTRDSLIVTQTQQHDLHFQVPELADLESHSPLEVVSAKQVPKCFMEQV